MTITFPVQEIDSVFKVGQRVKIDLIPFYKKPPYLNIEGTVYLVRVDFPLVWSNSVEDNFSVETLKFRYGIQPDTTLFPMMKQAEDRLYDVAEEYLQEIEHERTD